MRNARQNFGVVLTGALLATGPGCSTTSETGELPPALESQMHSAVSRVKHTRGVDRIGSLRVLSAFGSHATVPVRDELLVSEDPTLRSNAVYVLGEIYRLEGDPAALAAVKSSMADQDRSVRLEAARALLDGGDLDGLEVLLDGLTSRARSTRVHTFLALQRAAGGRTFGYDPDGDMKSWGGSVDGFRHYLTVAAE